MADTASLIVRVKTEGVETSTRQLNQFANSADTADDAVRDFTADLRRNNTEANRASEGGLKKFSGSVGNVSAQVQDMIVQISGGANAFTVIGQQGSQLASAFGPGGAVVGAVIAFSSAIGGMIYNLATGKDEVEDLEKAANELSKSFQTTKGGTLEFSDALVQLSQNGDAAYGSMVKLIGLRAEQQANDATTAIREQGKELLGSSVSAQTNIDTLDQLIAKNADVAQVLSSVNVTTDANSQEYGNLAVAVGELADKYGLGTQAVTDMLVAQRQFNSEPTAENAQKVADATTRAAQAATENKKELLDQAEAAQKNAIALETARKQQDLATDAQKRMGTAVNSTTKRIQEQNDAMVKSAQIATLSARDRAKAMAEADKEAFAKREGVTKDQIAAYNAARDEEARQDVARIDKTEKEKTDRVNKAAQNRADAQARRDETSAQRQQKQAQDFLDTLARQNQDELAAIDAQEQQKLAKLQEFQQTGAINAQQFEDAKTKIMLEADTARQEELDKRKEEQRKKDQKGDDFMVQILGQNAVELELFDIQQKQKEEVAKQYRDQGLIDEDEYQQALLAIAGNYNKKRRNEYASMLGQTTDDLKTALGEGNKAYKAFAIANAIMNTYQGAVAAFQSAAAIPLVGWIAAPVAAAAAVAAGLANVAKIRSAREQGGSLAAGGIAMVGERNKAELIMPAGASRVRTMEQVQQMMGGKQNNNGNGGVVIVNNTSAKIDSATTETDNEGRLRVIISETVSRALQDSNSDISKSRRATRGQPGFQ